MIEISLPSKQSILFAIILIAMGLGGYFYLSNTRPAEDFPENHFNKFAGVEWGTSPEGLLSRYPEDKIDSSKMYPETNTAGRRVVVSDYSMDGDTVDIGFVFHPELGLVKGFYYAHFGRGKDCLRVYEKFSEPINDKIGRYRTSKDQYNKLDVPFCYAVLVGKALKHSQWKTPEDLVITMILGGEKSKRRVRVFYETPAFYKWTSEIRGNTLGNYFPDSFRKFFEYLKIQNIF